MPPFKGIRVAVKLPWKGATSGEDQFVSMKEPIAKALGFEIAERKDLIYQVEIKYIQTSKDGTKTPKTKKVDRYRRPGYRTRSIRVEFGTNKNTGKAIRKGIAGQNVTSFQFPITSSVLISEVIDFFKTGKGKNIGAKRVVDANTGQGYPIA